MHNLGIDRTMYYGCLDYRRSHLVGNCRLPKEQIKLMMLRPKITTMQRVYRIKLFQKISKVMTQSFRVWFIKPLYHFFCQHLSYTSRVSANDSFTGSFHVHRILLVRWACRYTRCNCCFFFVWILSLHIPKAHRRLGLCTWGLWAMVAWVRQENPIGSENRGVT